MRQQRQFGTAKITKLEVISNVDGCGPGKSVRPERKEGRRRGISRRFLESQCSRCNLHPVPRRFNITKHIIHPPFQRFFCTFSRISSSVKTCCSFFNLLLPCLS